MKSSEIILDIINSVVKETNCKSERNLQNSSYYQEINNTDIIKHHIARWVWKVRIRREVYDEVISDSSSDGTSSLSDEKCNLMVEGLFSYDSLHVVCHWTRTLSIPKIVRPTTS